MNGIDIVALALIGGPLFAYVLCWAAASGWYAVKLRYQRRLVDGFMRGDADGK